MGRSPCCEENGLKKGPWTPEEDEKLVDYITKNGHGCWRTLPKNAGLKRCGKSCRLRWTNYLKPDIKRGKFSQDEERIIINLHSVLGNKWSKIATHLPGRTDNEIKNYWNTCLKKKLLQMGFDPNTHKPRTDLNYILSISQMLGTASQFGNSVLNPNALKLQAADTAQLATLELLQNLLQVINTTTTTPLPYIENNTTTTTTTTTTTGLFDGQLGNNSTNMSTLLNTQLIDYQLFQSPSGFVNGSINGSQAHVPNSWAEGDFGIDNKILNSNLGSSYSTSLPQLVSDGTCKNNQTESNNSTDEYDPPNYFSTNDSPDSTIFEAWEKLMDDETSETYWKDILELMS